jgi:hypothetical protein
MTRSESSNRSSLRWWIAWIRTYEHWCELLEQFMLFASHSATIGPRRGVRPSWAARPHLYPFWYSWVANKHLCVIGLEPQACGYRRDDVVQ